MLVLPIITAYYRYVQYIMDYQLSQFPKNRCIMFDTASIRNIHFNEIL